MTQYPFLKWLWDRQATSVYLVEGESEVHPLPSESYQWPEEMRASTSFALHSDPQA